MAKFVANLGYIKIPCLKTNKCSKEKKKTTALKTMQSRKILVEEHYLSAWQNSNQQFDTPSTPN
jgi:hypothetical protein